MGDNARTQPARPSGGPQVVTSSIAGQLAADALKRCADYDEAAAREVGKGQLLSGQVRAIRALGENLAEYHGVSA